MAIEQPKILLQHPRSLLLDWKRQIRQSQTIQAESAPNPEQEEPRCSTAPSCPLPPPPQAQRLGLLPMELQGGACAVTNTLTLRSLAVDEFLDQNICGLRVQIQGILERLQVGTFLQEALFQSVSSSMKILLKKGKEMRIHPPALGPSQDDLSGSGARGISPRHRKPVFLMGSYHLNRGLSQKFALEDDRCP